MKPLPRGGYAVRPFKAYKAQQLSYVEGSSVKEVSIDDATVPPEEWQWSGSTEPVNNSGLYKRPLYKSIKQVFYDSGSTIVPQFARGWSLTDTHGDGVYVISLSQNIFGEKIRPGSFRLSTPSSSGSIMDDGFGKLYPGSDTTTFVGNVFYSLGIAVVSKMNASSSLTGSVVSHEGIYLNTSDEVGVSFTSQVTIHEHIATCTVKKNEFNFSVNPTLTLFESSSVSGSTELTDALISGTLNPYITTVGLYDNVGRLLVVGKLPRPLKRIPEIDQTFIVRFDI